MHKLLQALPTPGWRRMTPDVTCSSSTVVQAFTLTRRLTVSAPIITQVYAVGRGHSDKVPILSLQQRELPQSRPDSPSSQMLTSKAHPTSP